jgi:uncharacterized protein
VKRYFLCSVLFLISWFSYGLTDIPQFSHRVIDTTKTLTESQKNALEASLIDFEKPRSDGAQIAVLMIAKLDNETVEHYANRVFNQWGIGKKGQDNGILLLIVKDDKQMRIEVGYGLEGLVTDLVASRIIREQLAPQFKQGNFNNGISNAIAALAAALTTSHQTTESLQSLSQTQIYNKQQADLGQIPTNQDFFPYFFLLIILSPLISIAISWFTAKRFAKRVLGSDSLNSVFSLLIYYLLTKNRRFETNKSSRWNNDYNDRDRSSNNDSDRFRGGGGGRSGGGGASGSW